MDGEEGPDSDALAANVEAWELEAAEEEAAATAAVVASSRNCRRRRDDTSDQQRQGGEHQVNSFADFNFDVYCCTDCTDCSN